MRCRLWRGLRYLLGWGLRRWWNNSFSAPAPCYNQEEQEKGQNGAIHAPISPEPEKCNGKPWNPHCHRPLPPFTRYSKFCEEIACGVWRADSLPGDR
jgi:hypothetical protein